MPPALYNVANMLATGVGCERDEAKARKWYGVSAEMGDGSAMFTFASWCARGRGGPEDQPLAFKWHEEAARLGHPLAAFNTAHHYLQGVGTTQVVVSVFFLPSFVPLLLVPAVYNQFCVLFDSLSPSLIVHFIECAICG